MDQPIIPFDLGRMFLGDAPALFYAEILVRTVIIYGYTLLLIRWIGGRSVAQLSMVDTLLVIALGSAVGDATFYDDVPLLQAMMVITVIVGLNKLIDTLNERSSRFKHIIDGRTVAVVANGRILPEGLRHRDLSALEVQAMLRGAGIANLGEVECAYLEAGGGLSVFRRDQPRPGLALVPAHGVLPRSLRRERPVPSGEAACCVWCGAIHPVHGDASCPDCGKRAWTEPQTPNARSGTSESPSDLPTEPQTPTPGNRTQRQ